jgi:predicted lipoprotein
MRFTSNFSALIVALVSTSLVTCSKDNKNSAESFDRTALLAHYAKNIIIPAYNNLAEKTSVLQKAANTFREKHTEANLQNLRKAWEDAILSWQNANHFNFGPAGEEGLRKGLLEEIGTFPIASSKIEASVNAGQWNTSDFNRNARGLLAIEYLLYGENQTVSALLAEFSVAPKRSEFLLALAEDVNKRVRSVSDAWITYQADFVKNAGTDAGSSISMLYNEFLRSHEALKNFKLGIPLGKRVSQVKTEPQLVEAYFSGSSLELLDAHFNAIVNLWYGNATVNGPGFKAYLENTVGGKELIFATETQLNVANLALSALPKTPNMAEQIKSSPAKLASLHTELQKLTRFFKSDMSSLLGIAITFSSGDGD